MPVDMFGHLERYIHMFDELRSKVYEMTGSVPVETAEEAPIDNGWTEAILNLLSIEEQLRYITYGINELMGENYWENHEQQIITMAWMMEAVAPLVNSRSVEILERHKPWEL